MTTNPRCFKFVVGSSPSTYRYIEGEANSKSLIYRFDVYHTINPAWSEERRQQLNPIRNYIIFNVLPADPVAFVCDWNAWVRGNYEIAEARAKQEGYFDPEFFTGPAQALGWAEWHGGRQEYILHPLQPELELE